MDWISLAEDRDEWLDLVNTVKMKRISWLTEELSDS